jgi:Phosphotransferase enzyme family
VLNHWDERALPDLLAANGLADAAETPFPNDGWSGASLTRLVRPSDGTAFILKRSSWAVDWIARSTRDHALREGFVASMPLPLPAPLVAPYHGAGAEGTTVGILMPDLSGRLLAWDLGGGPADRRDVARVLDALARLHAAPWPVADTHGAGHVWPTAPLAERILLLAPRSAARLAAGGLDAGRRFVGGWSAFERLAPRAALDLVMRLDADPAPLLGALDRLPATGLHGDLKLGNVALFDDGRIALIDWQMTMLAPVAVELGWLLVGNSGVLPDPPEAVLDDYRRAVEAVAGDPFEIEPPYDRSRTFPTAALDAVVGGADRDGRAPARFRTTDRVLGDWAAQVDLAWIVGLLLRGWRKGLDTASGSMLASGITAADDLAFWCARAGEAAARRL